MQTLLSGIGFGIIAGAILCISAIGFSLQFGMTNIFNLGYGTIMSLGALVAYGISGGGRAPLWLGAAAGTLTGGVASLAQGQLIFKPFARRRGAKVFELAMISVAIGLIGEFIMAAITRSQIFSFQFPTGSKFQLLGIVFTTTNIVIIGVAAASVALLELSMHVTRLGIAIRATSANPSLANASGIDTSKVVSLVWFVSGLFCGLGGVTLALSYQTASFTLGPDYLPYLLAVIVVAGIGSIGYCALVAVLLSLVIEISGGFGASSYNVTIALAVLVAMLLIRPQGIFGRFFEKTEVTV
jgi:branched-chain amino acid transport system permease protein/neutral amino acid transport system permease protein